MLRKLMLLGTVLGCCACQPSQLGSKEYLAWVENPDNGFHNRREMGEYVLGAQLMPTPYQAVQLHKASLDKQSLEEMKTELAESLDIRLTLAPLDQHVSFLKYQLESTTEYQARVNYLSFEMDDYVYLIQEGDTIRPNIYHFERAFDLRPEAHVFLSFPRPKNLDGDVLLVLEDQYFGMGPVRFRFDLHLLSHQPSLSLQS